MSSRHFLPAHLLGRHPHEVRTTPRTSVGRAARHRGADHAGGKGRQKLCSHAVLPGECSRTETLLDALGYVTHWEDPMSVDVPGDVSVRGDLRRADKLMSQEELRLFLADAYCGRTATIGRDGYPYVVPNLFVWMDERIFLHTARQGGHFLA